jgi:hypothetical protein
MGHLTLMAVDIVGALEKYPDDLLSILEPLLPQPAWDEYVIGPYAETQRMENIVLGGPRPQSFARNAAQSENGWGGDWDDGEDPTSPSQEFRRGTFSSRQTADFGAAPEEEDGTFHFNPSHGFGNGGWGSGSSSDSEDEHEAWLKNSGSATPHHTRDSENAGFDDSFEDSFEGNRGSRKLTQEEEVSFLATPVRDAKPFPRTTASDRSQTQKVTLLTSKQISGMKILILVNFNQESLTSYCMNRKEASFTVQDGPIEATLLTP